jgi:flagellar biogenesis protein FliO
MDCQSRRLVLGVTPTAISTLAELDPKDAAKIPPIASASLNENGPATRR